MDTELLKTFLEVEKTRHFGQAGDNLYLTQAAVSARIRQLENLLGNALFNRYRNNISLTPAGERLKPHAESLLTSLNRALQESSLGSDQSIQLAVGATPNLWDSAMQNYLHTIYQQLPGLSFRAEALGREQLSQQLLSRTLDIGFLFDPPKTEELVVREFLEIELVLVSSYSDVNYAHTFDNNYVKVDWGTAFSILHANLTVNPVTPILHTTTGRIALDFILANGGSAYLPASIADPYVESGALFNIADSPVVKRTVFSAFLESSEKQEIIQQALTILKGTEPEPASTLQP
ncbi:transcriptional regulator, LysR family protein [marine gamma proteobacterium HTCC2143]|jgi:DNA-binding transcriptional LysR family regulator|uniref:Transcriptional regulator, LysR family protein n=1 Tax=marine gamma proteobacterium HTCC2143 TaxID=247633 RepID=A0YFY3_9GAMM|nr:transcriptional regulator, LysR family protein [marine gamma proteobacterium HTCC2143]